MKRQFTHEDHNRQDKTRRPPYREEILLNPRHPGRPKPPKPPKPTTRYTLLLERELLHLAHPVIDALLRLNTSINPAQVTNAIKATLGKTAIRIHWIPGQRDTSKALSEALIHSTKLSRNSLPHQFLTWHDQVLERHKNEPSTQLEVPDQFHAWLRKLTTRASVPST